MEFKKRDLRNTDRALLRRVERVITVEKQKNANDFSSLSIKEPKKLTKLGLYKRKK